MDTSFPAGDLRVSDADRDRAVSELSEHFQVGRLTELYSLERWIDVSRKYVSSGTVCRDRRDRLETMAT